MIRPALPPGSHSDLLRKLSELYVTEDVNGRTCVYAPEHRSVWVASEETERFHHDRLHIDRAVSAELLYALHAIHDDGKTEEYGEWQDATLEVWSGEVERWNAEIAGLR